MRLETEQMAEVTGRADHRQGSHGVSFATRLASMANQANNRLSLAIDREAEATREKERALRDQQEVMKAISAVDPSHDEYTRGQCLAHRASAR